MSGENKSEDVERVRAAVVSLGEHFDSVQIFVTRHEAGEHEGTKHIELGSGNFFARYGQVQVWLAINDEDSRAHVKNRKEQE